MIEAYSFMRDSFRHHYGVDARLFRAPGRVNLIGEHTDYNDGFVLPLAIDRATIVAGVLRADRRVRVRSINFDQNAEFDLDSTGTKRRGIWLDYVEGVARVLDERAPRPLRGADLMIFSDIPHGAGLSSSAALEIGVGFALLSLSEVEINRVELALAAQTAEHVYTGTNCGIMDQLTAVRGRARHALLIDCRSLETTLLPLDTSEMVIAVCDTRIRHALASSGYNSRRAECELGVEILREVLAGVSALRDVSAAAFEAHEERLPEIVRRRCRHVLTENARTLQAASALRTGRMEEVGQLMFRSHESLRDDYEVSCAELDLMVEIAARVRGVAGARMTGGGFGGCTVNLVRRDALDEFREMVTSDYKRLTKLEPAIYVVEAGDGAQEIQDSLTSRD